MEDEKKLEPKRESQTSKETMTLVLEKEEEIEKEEPKKKTNLQILKSELETKKQMIEKEKAIVSPNYDLIQEISPEKRKKIYKIKKAEVKEEAKPHALNKKFKIILFSLVLFVGGAFCISSGVQLADAINGLNVAQTQYEANLPKLIKKISGIDNTNTTLELIETYPDEIKEPSSIKEQTNWFDKICNFISGLFGG